MTFWSFENTRGYPFNQEDFHSALTVVIAFLKDNLSAEEIHSKTLCLSGWLEQLTKIVE